MPHIDPARARRRPCAHPLRVAACSTTSAYPDSRHSTGTGTPALLPRELLSRTTSPATSPPRRAAHNQLVCARVNVLSAPKTPVIPLAHPLLGVQDGLSRQLVQIDLDLDIRAVLVK